MHAKIRLLLKKSFTLHIISPLLKVENRKKQQKCKNKQIRKWHKKMFLRN